MSAHHCMTSPMQASRLMDALRRRAAAAGFDDIAVADAREVTAAARRLAAFVAADRHGTMAWIEQTMDRRSRPTAMWPQARRAILLAMNYGPAYNPLDDLADRSRAVISCYARGKDYHVIVKKALKQVAGWLHRQTGAEVKVFVDTAPLMEKPLAERAGLGWQGKHTNLVSRRFGSWLFLGTILTTLDLPFDEATGDHCGRCRRCLDICPTDAFPAPYQLDARRCISYLTIEHEGHIPREFREKMGNRIFGCDDCLAVCPWNKFASIARETRLAAREGTDNPPLRALLALTNEDFHRRFAGTPIKRAGFDGLMRNILIAAGNSRDPSLSPEVRCRVDAKSPIVRAAAIWAYSRLADANEFAAEKRARIAWESDLDIKAEWEAAPAEKIARSGV